MPSKPSTFTAKTAFLSSQTRILSALPPLPSRQRQQQWRQKLPASDQPGDQPDDQHSDLSDSVLQGVLYKLSIVARKHHSLVYSSQTLRHVAEQIDALYWEATLGKEGDGVGPELAVLRAGADFRLPENIDALPERYPIKPASERHGEMEDLEEEYQTQRQRLKHCHNLLEGNRAKHAYYQHLRDSLRALENPVLSVQPNLVTRDARLNQELEKTKMLAVLLAVQVEKAALRWRGTARLPDNDADGGEENDEDDDTDMDGENDRFAALLVD